MKKSMIIAMSIVFAGMVLMGCDKENESGNNTGYPKSMAIQGLDVVLLSNPYTVEQHLYELEDPKESEIDVKLYQIASSVKDFLKTAQLNEYIINEASKHVNDCIDLRNFSEWSVLTECSFDKNKIDSAETVINTVDLTRSSTNPQMANTTEQYIPAIFVLNPEKADPTKNPIIGIGVDANEELPGMSKYEDYIVVWYYDDISGSFVEGLMNEEMSMRTTHPIFIIDNADEALTNRDKDKLSNNQTITTKGDGTDPTERFYLSSYEYKINVRNEGTGKSEFCVAGLIIDEDGDCAYITLWDNNGKDYRQIAKIAKNDVGVQLYKWVTFVHPQDVLMPDLAPLGYNYVFWNSFERDFARSQKLLGSFTAYGTPYYFYGRMKNNTDWYAYNPTTIQSHNINLTYIFNNGSQLFSNSKGNLGIWRINF